MAMQLKTIGKAFDAWEKIAPSISPHFGSVQTPAWHWPM